MIFVGWDNSTNNIPFFTIANIGFTLLHVNFDSFNSNSVENTTLPGLILFNITQSSVEANSIVNVTITNCELDYFVSIVNETAIDVFYDPYALTINTLNVFNSTFTHLINAELNFWCQNAQLVNVSFNGDAFISKLPVYFSSSSAHSISIAYENYLIRAPAGANVFEINITNSLCNHFFFLIVLPFRSRSWPISEFHPHLRRRFDFADGNIDECHFV